MGDVNDMACDGNTVCDQAKIISVAPSLWVRQAVDNMGWVDVDGGLAVIDTLEDPHARDEVFAAIEKTTGGLPVRWVLNTHDHSDHIALNKAFKKRWNAQIISHKNGEVPTRGVRRIGAGSGAIQMVHLPGCHTPEDCVIWVPQSKTLFTGDLFGWGLVPYNGNLRPGQGDLIRDTYMALIRYNAKTVVPGHGPICSTKELTRWLAYFDQLRATVKHLFNPRMSLADVLAAIPPPDDMLHWWRFAAWKHADSVKKIVKAVRKGWL
ncbi:MAG: MBL fold metallo-hydrolase [Lentisphaeria bacterium]|nr:MBL fold metallo-hydrolase [Lentisphaeria bacterium]